MHTFSNNSSVKWVEKQTGLRLTEPQARCIMVTDALGQPYNIYLAGVNEPTKGWNFSGESLFLRLKNPISTYDNDALTHLVLLAHKYCVRVEISPKSFSSLEIMLTPKEGTTGSLFTRHPSLSDLIAKINIVKRN